MIKPKLAILHVYSIVSNTKCIASWGKHSNVGSCLLQATMPIRLHQQESIDGFMKLWPNNSSLFYGYKDLQGVHSSCTWMRWRIDVYYVFSLSFFGYGNSRAPKSKDASYVQLWENSYVPTNIPYEVYSCIRCSFM